MNRRGAKPSEELRHFTNREKEKELFQRLLEGQKGAVMPLVMFYGVGGIGKTWLTKQARQEWLPDNMPSARLDFDTSVGTSYMNDSAAALAEIRRQLNVPCPRFDLAYAMMRYKQGVKDEPLLRSSGAAGTAWELVTEGLSAATNSFPGGNLLVWITKKAGSGINKRLKASGLDELFAGDGEQEFFDLRRLDPQDIHARLSEKLGRDLEEKLPARDGKACQAVVFLDTFEALRIGIHSDAQQYEREKWIGEFYAQCVNVLFVIAGRDCLTWDEFDADWRKSENLEQHLLGGLSDHDARHFLTNCGILSEPLQNAVLAASVDVDASSNPDRETAYHPFSLGLCADAVANEGGNSDPQSFSMTPGDFDRLAQRFLKSLANAAHEDWILRLALTPRFDEAAAREAFSPVRDAVQNAAWNALKDYSFVSQAEQPGWFTLHVRMQEALRERFDDPAKENDSCQEHEWWRTYWHSRAQSEIDEYAALAWYHLLQIDAGTAFDEWNTRIENSRMYGNPDMVLHYRLLDWWTPTHFKTRIPIPDNAFTAQVLNDLGVEWRQATLGHRAENYMRALTYYLAALRFRTETEYPYDFASTMNNMAVAFASYPDENQDTRQKKAIECLEATLRVYSEQSHPMKWATTQMNLGIAYANISTDGEQNVSIAINCFQNALRKLDVHSREWAAAQVNLSGAYALMMKGDREKNLEEAVSCCKAALDVFRKNTFAIHWANTKINLGNIYKQLSDVSSIDYLTLSYQCYIDALDVFTEEAYPAEAAYNFVHIALIQGHVGEYKAAFEAYIKAITCYNAAGMIEQAQETQKLYEQLATYLTSVEEQHDDVPQN